MKRAALLFGCLLSGACRGQIGGVRETGGGNPDAGAPGAAETGHFAALTCAQPKLGDPVLRLLNRAEFQRTLDDIFPEVKGQWNSSLPADAISPFGFDNDGAAVVGTQYAEAVLDAATSLATAVTGAALANLLPCSTSAPDAACADQFLGKYGRRLFRRPLTSAEHDRYLGFFTASLAKSDFATALQWMTVGLVQSPSALYRREIGTPVGDGTLRLSPYEVATELAYAYSGSTPSETLLSLADSGSLGDPVSLATSLLAADSSRQAIHHFFESYLGYTRILSIEKTNIPSYDAARGDMVGETRAFLEDVIFARGGGLAALLTSPTTNPSLALAGYYGFPSPASDYAPVMRPAGKGIGMLAQGSVLASHAQPNGSSPTQRGLLVFQHLLCEQKPTPPPNVPQIGDPEPGVLTTRQRYETAHAVGYCASCHKLFDPIGFGFEHFDEGGRFRTDDNGLPIDSAAGLPGPDGTPLFSFQGEEDLVQGLTNLSVIYQCFSAYLATYSFGVGDACLGASRVADFQAGRIGVGELFAAMAAEPHFTLRTSP